MVNNATQCSATADASLAYLLLRVTIGVNIFIHGVTRILGGTSKFAFTLDQGFRGTPLPPSFVFGFAMALPWIEAVIGFLVLIGLFSRLALSVGALLILVLTFGSTLHQDWESAGLQLIYASVYAALLAFSRHNTFSLDKLIHRNLPIGEHPSC